MARELYFGLMAAFLGLGLVACNETARTPYIGENGNWWINSSDLGVPAQGPAGQDGKDGNDGNDGNDGKDGQPGQAGQSITVVSVEKTATDGLVDTYTITFSDGTSSSFTVTNGENLVVSSIEKTDSTGLVDTYTITFSNNATYMFSVTNGKDGENLSVLSIEHTGTDGLIETYAISYSDGSTYTFVVSNGANGLTPYIGENGNWWIGEEDTGVLVDGNKAQDIPLTIYSDGLEYKAVTFGGKSGYVVTGWNIYDYDDVLSAYTDMTNEEINALYDDNGLKNAHLVIPNYFGNVPVIGVSGDARLNFGKVTLSRNTLFLGDGAFKDCNYLKEIDFHNAGIKAITYDCFSGSSLSYMNLPSSVTTILDRAFQGCTIVDCDFSNVKYIGSSAFDCSFYNSYVYLPETVETVGYKAFGSIKVYYEGIDIPSSWAASIYQSDNNAYAGVVTNCKIEGDYLYTEAEGEITVHQYLGNDRSIEVPTTIEGKPVTKIGGGFASIAPSQATRVWTEAYLRTGKLSAGNRVDVIKLPDGVKEIGHWAFYSPSEMVLIPNTIEKVSVTILYEFSGSISDASQEDIAYAAQASERYFVFEGEDLPSIISTSGGVVSDWTKEAVIGEEDVRVAFGVDFDILEFDGCFCYRNDGETYSLFSFAGLQSSHVVVPASFNQKPVTTILTNAFGFEKFVRTITIESGIEAIKTRAFRCDIIEWVYIPATTTVINANGFDNLGNYDEVVYVELGSKSEDWNSSWANGFDNVVYGVGEIHENAFFRYAIRNNQVSLLKYLGDTANVMIPQTIDELPVAEIKTGFLRRTDYNSALIYIPLSVTKIRAEAFYVGNNTTCTFFCQAASMPEDWDSNWISGNGTKSVYWNHAGAYFNYTYGEDYIYLASDSSVKLLAYLKTKTEIRVPRTIESKAVTAIGSYCYSTQSWLKVYIPQEVVNIADYGFYINSSTAYTSYFYVELSSKPSGWTTNCWYNRASSYSSNYCVAYYGQTLDY